ncbi:MAG: type toxin-antitoxin system RelE/ParE family toxin [Mucilaginibacter sp.]|uniref:type II toxin-antitoxin system RelE/ParE family toxin n=1 Tax=Mucilaginibacter sp. TaxID=1882438 RepID=UPI002639A9F0|nr:type II toxin-antitoxin system RelE/ParE family toxin [Mucilaginibacter sp.]MDB5002148.1 type toxin-antitoxin system RelE/ParE family toxin [Mucilaginibacter sp.]
MAKKIAFSKRAFIDIERITDFNNNRNQSDTYSRKFLTGLNKRLLLLPLQPESGIATQRDNTRLLIWDQFYIFYGEDDNSIEIKSIYHQKENVVTR